MRLIGNYPVVTKMLSRAPQEKRHESRVLEDPLARACLTVGQIIVRGEPEADFARDAHVESPAEGHAEAGISGTSGKIEGGAAGTERCRGVGDTERVGERRRSRVIAQFQLWPNQETGHSRIALCKLGWTCW